MSRFYNAGGQMTWDMDAKMAIFNEWNPDAARTYDNFNPFERDSNGNCCDTNGKFPGDGGYADPVRPETNWEAMQRDRAFMDELNKNPKMAIAGKPGNWKAGWDAGLGPTAQQPSYADWKAANPGVP